MSHVILTVSFAPNPDPDAVTADPAGPDVGVTTSEGDPAAAPGVVENGESKKSAAMAMTTTIRTRYRISTYGLLRRDRG